MVISYQYNKIKEHKVLQINFKNIFFPSLMAEIKAASCIWQKFNFNSIGLKDDTCFL